MVIENLAQFTAEETRDEDKPERPPPRGNGSDPTPEVTLVIPSPGGAVQLRRFICQVEETLQARIHETIGSWSDTHVTLKLQRPVSLPNILDELAKIPEVEEVEEKAPIRRRLFSFSKKIQAMPRKKISVTLRGQALPLTAEGQAKQYLKLPKLQPQMVGGMVS